MALTPTQPHEQPLLYEQSLQLLYSLAEHLQSREAMLTLLRQPPYSMLTSQIGHVLQADESASDEVCTDLNGCGGGSYTVPWLIAFTGYLSDVFLLHMTDAAAVYMTDVVM